MRRKSILYILFLGIMVYLPQLKAQEEHTHVIDSAMAISPLYMPVSYTCIRPHLFTLLSYTEVDTAIDRVQYYSPFYSIENLYQTLGIPTQAHQKIGFDFFRERGFSYITLPYPLYLQEQRDLKFYDVKTSFTKLAYTFGLPKENSFNVIHAQRIKRVTAVANLRAYTNPGYFVHQVMNYISADAQVQYTIPSEKYGFRVSYIFNRFNLNENGGLADYRDDTLNLFDYHDFLTHTDTDLKKYKVNTSNASSKIVSHDLLLQQYVKLQFKKNQGNLNLGVLSHTFQFKNTRTNYFNLEYDTVPVPPTSMGDSILDSLRFFSIINTLQWSTFTPFQKIGDQPNFFHFAGGIMHEYTEDKLTYYLKNSFTLFARTNIRLFSVMDISGQVSYSFNSYYDNDAMVDGSIRWAINRKKEHFIGLQAHYYRISPDYIFSRYSGHYHEWDTTWNKQNIFKLSAYWTRKHIKASFNYYMLHQYMIFDENQQPFCIDDYANIFQVHLYTPLKFKNFGFNSNLYLQYSTNSYIDLPLFAGKATAYYIFHVFKRRLQIQVGLDLMYNTFYYANAYSPSLHQFYYQKEFRNGNYLYLDANVNLKIQRIGIFMKVNNILSGLMGHDYFTTPYYPMTPTRFAIGINWRFYD